ncbi:MAG TPA: serine hydrolase domain-containing protein [Pyrinomonadaceae bacterium]|nr:serine hydrolase domain-containing protein [Pyrinomonadaceae bacterium]
MLIHSYYLSGIIACILIFAPSINAQSNTPSPDFSEVRKLIETEMAARKIPSISVVVARRGEIIWEEAFGFADKEKGIRADKETMYYTASVTKTFTATAIAVLAERKQIDLDRPINDYIRPMQVHSPLWNSKEATVRMVAQHMAGLTTFGRNCWADQSNCRISADETIKRYGILFWRPGDHFDYSNLGYGILGEAIRGASRKSYTDFMRDEVFRSLGMTHASVGIGPGFEKHAAVRYSSVHGPRATAYSASPAASGVYCNAHGLALFGMFHLKAHLRNQKAILSDKSVEMMQNSTVSAGGSSRYGMGWWVNEDLNGYRGLLGQGGTDDAMAFLQLIPSEEIVVVMLTNTGDQFPPKIVDEILSVMLPPYRLKREAASNGGAKQPSTPAKPSSPLVGDWMGHVRTYRGDVPFTFSIEASGDIQAKLRSASATAVNRFEFTDRGLIGRLTGNLNLGTDDDSGPEPYDLDVELYLKDDVLYGAVTTRPRPSARYGARLSYWVELRKRP